MAETAPIDGARNTEEAGATPKGLTRWLPGLALPGYYQAAWFPKDLVAGLVLTSMLVPVGIAYAAASGVPGIYGLYASIVPLLAYALFGPSRIIVLGPDSALSTIIFATIVPLSNGDPIRAVALAGAMALVSGLALVTAGLARLGFITELLSKPIRYGFMNGIALTVLLNQLPKLFGFSIKADGPLRQIAAIVQAIVDGKANLAALAVGGSCLILILASKRFLKVPGLLLAVVAATVAVDVFDLARRYGVSVLGPLPHGLPVFTIPIIGTGDLNAVVIGGLTVALVAFADTSVLSRTYAAKLNQRVDPNQEMIALGAANIATGLFQGFPMSSSSSRTPVAEAAGAKTQVTGIVGAIGITLLLLFAPNLLEHLPSTALAAVVIAAAIGLFEIGDLARIYRMQRWEFWLSIVCFVGVAVFGAITGIAVAVTIAVIEFLWDGWRPHSAVLGRVDQLSGYHDITRHPDAKQVPGLVLFRWDAPLFFANAELFRDRVTHALEAAPTPTRWLVVAAEPVTSIDVTAADILDDIDTKLHEAGVELCFAEMKDPVKDKLKRFGLFSRLGEKAFFPTLGESVSAYLKAHNVDWKDWKAPA